HRPTGADSDHGGEPPVFFWVDPNWRTYTVATAAQIEANRRNAQRSTGPKTDEGKARVRRNALKHGMAALTIMPVLPQKTRRNWKTGPSRPSRPRSPAIP